MAPRHKDKESLHDFDEEDGETEDLEVIPKYLQALDWGTHCGGGGVAGSERKRGT